MKKKQSESLAQGKPQKKNAKHIPDSEIDFSDIPELSSEELALGKRVGRPKSKITKQMIAFRIDPRLLATLRRIAKQKRKPYQTLLHELLEEAVHEAA